MTNAPIVLPGFRILRLGIESKSKDSHRDVSKHWSVKEETSQRKNHFNRSTGTTSYKSVKNQHFRLIHTSSVIEVS